MNVANLVDILRQRPSRINVIGASGSGKSTFAKKLSNALQYPYIEMDKIFWKPNWQQPSDEEFFANLENALNKPQWVLDGNYGRSLPVKWKEVEVVVWLDLSFSRVLLQMIRRTLLRALTREELWEGTNNRESFRKSFLSKSSIIWWMITTHGNFEKNFERYVSNPKFSHIRFVRLRSHREAEKFVQQFSQV